ncbi:MAG TPA: hypothetical protein VKH43_02910 [Thermoanaerobaculia bacterium]|nr:hypothetical protein [Thermoanaerobaculia bacterium]
MNLTPSQSHYVLGILISQGRIRAGHVRNALKSREQEIRMLRERLASLEQLSSGGVRALRGRRRRAVRRAVARRIRRAALSPKVRALRRLQGKYMGYVRRLKAAEKARVRSVREKQGMLAAIKLARSLAKS